MTFEDLEIDGMMPRLVSAAMASRSTVAPDEVGLLVRKREQDDSGPVSPRPAYERSSRTPGRKPRAQGAVCIVTAGMGLRAIALPSVEPEGEAWLSVSDLSGTTTPAPLVEVGPSARTAAGLLVAKVHAVAGSVARSAGRHPWKGRTR